MEISQSRQYAIVHRRRGPRRLERAPGDPLVGLDVGQRGLPDQPRGNFRNIIFVRITSRGDPGADHVLVEAVGTLAGQRRRCGSGVRLRSSAAGTGSVDLVGEADGFPGVDAELAAVSARIRPRSAASAWPRAEQGESGFALPTAATGLR